MTPWLHIIGIGENGWAGLSPDARAALELAEVIIGGDRHHGLAPDLTAERIRWPSPFRTLSDDIGKMRGRRVAVLVTGDPLWYSAGAHLVRKFPGECEVHPQLSAFQWAAARMGWSLADVEKLTIHGRPAEQIIPAFGPDAKLLVLTQDATSPAQVAQLLDDRGYGDSRLTVLGALGGPQETMVDGTARDWSAKYTDFHILAVECLADAGSNPLPVTGLPDDAFIHDGQITKREIRALTLAALSPRSGAILWDIGAGSGSVGIEFMRAAKDAMTYALERDATRAANIRENAIQLGTPRLKVIKAAAPNCLADLPAPDAVFVGGGLSRETITLAMAALKPHGHLVANAVTLESEALLGDLNANHGGTLTRIAISRAGPAGNLRGWKPMMPVTQWIFTK